MKRKIAIVVAGMATGWMGCVTDPGETGPGHDDDSVDAVGDAAADALAPAVVTVRLADTVVAAPGATGSGFFDSAKAVNGVRGAGSMSGSLDVFSLTYAANKNYITLRWSGGRLRNGAGNDFAVFENPFLAQGGTFMDLIIVEVSVDGVSFRELPHKYNATTPTVYSNNAALWQGFAGKAPVLLNADTNPVDPFNATAAGGDQFDLSNVVGTDATAVDIRTNGVRYVRLVSASSRVNPDTGAVYVHDALSNGPDIDGVYGKYVEAE